MSSDSSSKINGLVAEIEDAQEALALLRQSLNIHQSTIADLPPEILGAIFCALRDICIYQPEDNHAWFSVMYVCRSWRDAAAGCPELWTHLHTDLLQLCYWPDTLLHSGVLPLHLVFNKPRPVDLTIISILAHQFAHRIESLEIVDIDEEFLDDIEVEGWHECFFQQPLLALKSLSLNVMTTIDEPLGSDFLQIAPENVPLNLQQLDLNLTPFEWSSAIYNNLTELRLSYMQGACAPSLGELALLFSRMHRLEVLEMTGVNITVSDVTDIIPPRSLSIVYLSLCWCLNFPACIVPSSVLHFYIDAAASVPAGRTAASNYADDFLTRHVSPNSIPKAYELGISRLRKRGVADFSVAYETCDKVELDIRIWRADDHPDTPGVVMTIPVDVTSRLHNFLGAAALKHITEATFDFDFNPSSFPFDWHRLLRRSPQLHTLKLLDGAFEHLVALLSTDDHLWMFDKAPLRDLRYIVVKVTKKFAEGLKKREDPVAKFARWLRARKNYGMAVDNLVISACSVKDARLRSALRAAVRVVEFTSCNTAQGCFPCIITH
ncbi:hypothetical protein K488DRAFT_82244 [Vararia minispora EC-137]|uniref:Uncharacterized protein n=1 Tax=Vararia minispora EC-137 TaxID=1314806 RepID=A0ACB8QXJ4_9AGAM|nr:hypothetical protein K488DRAFT_82244 [Vararia minispora EC-137]